MEVYAKTRIRHAGLKAETLCPVFILTTIIKSVTEESTFVVSPEIGEVSYRLDQPDRADSVVLLAHGAGANMHHVFMKKLTANLIAQDLAVLRYQFPYMEHGRKRPDKPVTAYETIRAAYELAKKKCGGLPLFLSGKSYGGRMSSQAVAAGYVTGASGIIFYGFPLHAPGKPSLERGDHLYQVELPMLFCQGTKDKLADMDLIKTLTKKLGHKAELHVVGDVDHSFRLPKTSNVTYEQVLHDLAITTGQWIREKTRLDKKPAGKGTL